MTAAELGARTTAEEALGGVSLAGRVAIVTGASSGIGVETVRVLSLAGAQVIMGTRSVAARGRRSRASLPRTRRQERRRSRFGSSTSPISARCAASPRASSRRGAPSTS
jgi:NAD(P)-dependent dehydrogenase (short-subunit alcohol dehydrogenase family)